MENKRCKRFITAEPNVFEAVKSKQMLEKAAKLFEPTKISIIPKGKNNE